MKKTLQEMRESKGVMKGAVANAIGCSYPTYKRYEENPSRMKIEQLDKACAFLGCTRDDIFLPSDLN